MTTTYQSTPPARTATRITVSYSEYVHAFARMAAWYAILTAAGVSAIVGAIVYTFSGWLLVLAVAGGLGLLIGGGVGLLAALSAHATYTRYLATTTATTYQTPPQAAALMRPFVASTNAPRTIRCGRIALPQETWAALFRTAEANGGRLTRDDAAKVLPRPLYRDWQSTMGEMARLGLVDDDGRVTAAAWRFIRRDVSPYPVDDDPDRAHTGTHARRTHEAHEVTL